MVKNLEIFQEDWGTIGYAVQKGHTEKNSLGPKTHGDIKKLAEAKNVPPERIYQNILATERVLCMHNFKKQPIVIHSDYLLFLKEKFLINENYIISHVIEFVHSPFLNYVVSNYLKRRKLIKDQIALLSKNVDSVSIHTNEILNLKSKSNLLKLNNNSMYGYSLLRNDKYTTTQFMSNKEINFLKTKRKLKITGSSMLFRNNYKMHFCVDTIPAEPSYSACHIGSAILFMSKNIFLSNVHFIFSHADFRKIEFLYMDTDSLHLLVNSKKLEENMLPSLKKAFESNAHKHLGGYPDSPICGVFEPEGDFPCVTYRGEKIYSKFSDGDNNLSSEIIAKGLPKSVKKHFLHENSENSLFVRENDLPFLAYWKTIQADSNFNMYISIQTKEMANSLIPLKRFFYASGHSKVLP